MILNLKPLLLDLELSITNGIVSSKTCDSRVGFNFAIVNLPFLSRDDSRSPSLFRMYFTTRVCFNVSDFNSRNKCLPAKLIKAIDIQTRQIKHRFKETKSATMNIFRKKK